MLTTPNIQSVRHALLAVGFSTFLWLPLSQTWLGLGEDMRAYDEPENIEWPTFDWTDTKASVRQINAWHDDNLGYRNTLIHWHSHLKTRLLNTSPHPRAVVGREGWLYLRKDLNDYKNHWKFTPEQLTQWQTHLETKQAWFAQQGITYLFVLAPEKHTIYPEYQPAALGYIGENTLADQFVDHMRHHAPQVPLLDLRPTLHDARQQHQVYYRGDSHWTDYGGYAVYRALLKELSQHHRKLKPLRLRDFYRVEHAPGTFMPVYNFDLARLVGLQDFYMGVEPVTELRTPQFECPWKRCPQSRKTVLVVHDSYFNVMIAFLRPHFRKKVYLRIRAEDRSRFNLADFHAAVERSKPHIVIEELAERLLNRIPSNATAPVNEDILARLR